MPKVLVIRFSSMGDVLLTTPIVRAIKEQIPGAEIHYLVKHKHMGVLKGNPHIHRIYTFKGDLRKLTQKLYKERYDFVVDLQRNLRSAYVKMRLKRKSYTYPKYNFAKWLYTRFRVNMMPPNHIVDRYFLAVADLGVKYDGKGLDFFVREKDQVQFEQLPQFLQGKYIVYNIGGTYFTKRMPIKKMIHLVGKLKYPVILVGGEEDHTSGHELEKNFPGKVYNACGKFSIGGSADLIRRSLYVISHDTGMMHVAAALGKPIASIWGNTTPEFGMVPFYEKEPEGSKLFEIKGLSCRPCSKLGHSACPKKHFKCMEMQDTKFIADVVNKTCDSF